MIRFFLYFFFMLLLHVKDFLAPISTLWLPHRAGNDARVDIQFLLPPTHTITLPFDLPGSPPPRGWHQKSSLFLVSPTNFLPTLPTNTFPSSPTSTSVPNLSHSRSCVENLKQHKDLSHHHSMLLICPQYSLRQNDSEKILERERFARTTKEKTVRPFWLPIHLHRHHPCSFSRISNLS